jgi:hypothetical protein
MNTSQTKETVVPGGIFVTNSSKETMVSPLTNASVASSAQGEKAKTKKSTAASAVTASTKKKLGLAACESTAGGRKTTAATRPSTATNKRKAPATSRAGSSSPTREGSNKARRTTGRGGSDTGAPKRSPRILEKERLEKEALDRRTAILHAKKHTVAGAVAAARFPPGAQRNLHANDEDDGDALSMDDEEEEEEMLEEEDIEDAMMIADTDQLSGPKQTLAKKAVIKFEKQFVALSQRKGKRITAVSFAKGYFHIPMVKEEGKDLLSKTEEGEFSYACLPCFMSRQLSIFFAKNTDLFVYFSVSFQEVSRSVEDLQQTLHCLLCCLFQQ